MQENKESWSWKDTLESHTRVWDSYKDSWRRVPITVSQREEYLKSGLGVGIFVKVPGAEEVFVVREALFHHIGFIACDVSLPGALDRMYRVGYGALFVADSNNTSALGLAIAKIKEGRRV